MVLIILAAFGGWIASHWYSPQNVIDKAKSIWAWIRNKI
jgi:hypothetical protein